MTTYARFRELRERVMAAIEKQLEMDSHCKSYEGIFEVRICYPSYFDDPKGTDNANFYVIELHCYVLGPSRHYEWSGKTFDEAVTKAEAEINDWLNDMEG